MMKFSFLMPTKDRPHMLRTAMKHIFSQDYKDFEAVIVDDSVERNEELARLSSADTRVKYHWRRGKGIGSAMNDALRISTGDILNWHNDDDFIAKRTLKFVSENIAGVEWCYGRIVIMNRFRIPVGLMGRAFDYELEKRRSVIPQPAVFWTRKAFETVGFFDETIDHVTDYDYWLRLGANFEPKFFNRFFAYYIVHPDMGTKKFPTLKTEQWLKVQERFKGVTPRYQQGRNI